MFKRSKSKEERTDLIDVSEPYDKPENIAAPAPRELSEEDQVKYTTILKHFQDPELLISTTEDGKGEKKPLIKSEKLWLTRECIMRYLRATKGKTEESIQRLEQTIAWRREFGITGQEDKVTPELVEPENFTGKQVILGFDKNARPILYFKPGRQNTKTSFRQIQSTVWFLERVIDMMPAGQETLALLIDFKHHKVEGETSKLPAVSTGKQVLHILQSHYPERLGKAMFVNQPLVATLFLKAIYPFIDPLTKEKLIFDAAFTTVVNEDQLDKEYDGRLNFEYKHSEYWPALVKLTQEKRAHLLKRFETLGATVGISEYDLKGDGDVVKFPVA
ncbi:CYFA0S10e00760g1_1 [Cyberlindnera fabianii]|uniref:SEC14 homolog 3 n=1 Tax=Cyberlindnera fabianii TaxID=36022 RepID=A0A061B4S1_CYBFA|nr:Phosphatidylinositol transfer protein PDR16 [Cyberlindnera fabianii]CDR42654.1 CYFA0S10e00760g1_1 [Cyberlindnera fabianii]